MATDAVTALATMNAARVDANEQHGSNCRPLAWDDGLAAQAQSWANTMAQTGQFYDNPPPGCGSNVFMYEGTNAQPSFNAAAQGWCNEISSYWGQPIDGNFGVYGHYTAIVWPTTTKTGMGIAQGSNGAFYVCALFPPVGNYQGQSAWGSGPENPAPPMPPPGGWKDGIYLVNGSNGSGSLRTGFAWYAKLDLTANAGNQPDAFIYLATSGAVPWEGASFSGTYPDGNTFSCSVDTDGQTAPAGSIVGKAKNNYHPFTIYKVDGNVLFQKDGYSFSPIYMCVN